MDMIASTKLSGRFRFFEADYLFFVLDLDARLGETVEPCRPGLGLVTRLNVDAYIEFMKKYAVNTAEIQDDFDSLGDEELLDAKYDFLPTVLIDFDLETFFSSHPEDHYLNFEEYLPPHWIFERVDDVPSMIPHDQAYWTGWSRLTEAC